MKSRARLNNWTIGTYFDDSPCTTCLFGEVYGHPKFPDGKAVVTSQIVSVDLIKKVAETQFTIYDLEDQSDIVFQRFQGLVRTLTDSDEKCDDNGS